MNNIMVNDSDYWKSTLGGSYNDALIDVINYLDSLNVYDLPVITNNEYNTALCENDAVISHSGWGVDDFFSNVSAITYDYVFNIVSTILGNSVDFLDEVSSLQQEMNTDYYTTFYELVDNEILSSPMAAYETAMDFLTYFLNYHSIFHFNNESGVAVAYNKPMKGCW